MANATLYLHNISPAEIAADFANKKGEDAFKGSGNIRQGQEGILKGMQGKLVADRLVAQ